MEGRLKKIGNEYKLYAQDDSCIATSWYSPYQRLSKKNCEAIANGYDLDELVRKYMEQFKNPMLRNYMLGESYFEGFQKALEILGDKKFSEDDVIYMIERSNNMNFTAKHLISNHKKTEWDVEIETIEYGLGNDENGRPIFETRYLLDGNDCLILKRK